MRQIVLDTETTGLEVTQDHRIIEIGAVEIDNRRLTGQQYHQYIQPDRSIDAGALEVHGISEEFLADKPRFADIADEFLNFVEGAEVVIHNAAFDVAFLDYELRLCNANTRMDIVAAGVIDSLAIARKEYPGQRNNLDALCKRLGIDNSRRKLHGALLDAEILADVYLAMTGGQTLMSLDATSANSDDASQASYSVDFSELSLPTVEPSEQEASNHLQWVERLNDKVDGQCVWSRLDAGNDDMSH